MKKLIALTLLFLPWSSNISLAQDHNFAEDSPKLGIGTDRVMFEKGDIDATVLMSVVVEKQQEIRDEFIKRNLGNGIVNQGLAAYNLMTGLAEALLNYSNPKVIQKNLLKEIGESAMVFTIAKSYLHLNAIRNEGMDSLKVENLLDSLVQISDVFQEKDSVSVSWLFHDIVLDVLQGDSTEKKPNDLLKKGFFRSGTWSKTGLEERVSLYYRLRASLDPKHEAQLVAIRNEVKKKIDFALQYHDVFSASIINNYDHNFETYLINHLKVKPSIKKVKFSKEVSTFQTKLATRFEKLQSDFEKQVQKAVLIEQQKGLSANQSIIDSKTISDILAHSKTVEEELADQKIPKGISYYFEHVVDPTVNALVATTGDFDFLKDVELIQRDLEVMRLVDFKDESEKVFPGGRKSIETIQISEFASLAEILQVIDELDKAQSYETLLTALISNLPVFINTENQRLAALLMQYLQDLSTFDSAENVVEIDVEELILKWYEYAAPLLPNKNVKFYFGIGLNQSVYVDRFPEEKEKVKSLGFATEKIGLSVDLINFQKKRLTNSGFTRNIKAHHCLFAGNSIKTEKTLVTAWNLKGYAGGLLYNVLNLSTEHTMDGVILGVATGLRFFNNLELNLNYSLLYGSGVNFPFGDVSTSFWTVSFDVPIVDYISAKKRRKSK